jgi:hypothetical protein
LLDDFSDYLNNPHWGRQHAWRRAIWRTMARVGLTGTHALPINRRWIDIQRRPMPLRNLDPALSGLKLVQISDLHYSPVVWAKYLAQFMDWINELEPDLVVVTGDLITGGYRYADGIAEILTRLTARHGVICTFGNHDYSIYGKTFPGESRRRGDYLQRSLADRGLIVLRNEAFYLRAGDGRKPVAIVGLDDEWSGNIDADAAFAGVDPALPAICLNHNPVNCRELMSHEWQWMLSGHTHGRQVGAGTMGRRFYPHKFRHYTHGYYSVNGRHLYVNRGLSYGQRVLDWCRPEVTVFKLESDPATPPSADSHR